MNKIVILHVSLILLTLSIVPMFNLAIHHESKTKIFKKASLYNFDFAISYLNRSLFKLGISTDPNDVIIGKNNWLFLGDKYQNSITAKRCDPSFAQKEKIEKISLATSAWDHYLKQHGVQLFKILICADKETIYPEYLPSWAYPSSQYSTNILLLGNNDHVYIDSRNALKMAKKKYNEPLYYPTDTHWTTLGAWVAYQTLMNEIGISDKSLHSIPDKQVKIVGMSKGHGGDLSTFLKLQNTLEDYEVNIDINSKDPILTEQFNFDTGQLILQGDNRQVSVLKNPVLVKSKFALNDKKVLWVRDSFGGALSPYIAATFTETLQVHYEQLDSDKFITLLGVYKPDYVIISVVERLACADWFWNLSPLATKDIQISSK